MSREGCERLLAEIHAARVRTLNKLADVSETEFGLPTTMRPWKWDTLLRLLLQFGDHMREHATHIEGARAAFGRPPTQPQRILAEAEIARGALLAATVGLTDEDLDAAPSDGGWTVRRILEHIRNSEQDYLEAIRLARAAQPVAREG